MPTRKSTIVGVFNTRTEAERAIDDLKKARFKGSQIGLVARDADGRIVTREGGDGAESLAEEGAVAGAVAGAGAGALVGLGVLSGVIPVVGPAIAAGTLGVILTNAVGGAAIAGIVGALIGLGIPEEDASFYEGEVKEGRFLVTVSATDGRAAEAWDILHRRGAYNRATPAVATTNVSPAVPPAIRDVELPVVQEEIVIERRTTAHR